MSILKDPWLLEDDYKKILKAKLSDDQYRSVTSGKDEIFSDLDAAMEDDDIILSEYISSKMGWLFDTIISSRDKDVILYFADRLQEYSLARENSTSSIRKKRKVSYKILLIDIIEKYYYKYYYHDITEKYYLDTGKMYTSLEKVLEGDISTEENCPIDNMSGIPVLKWLARIKYIRWQVAYELDHYNHKVEDAVRHLLTKERYNFEIMREATEASYMSFLELY